MWCQNKHYFDKSQAWPLPGASSRAPAPAEDKFGSINVRIYIYALRGVVWRTTHAHTHAGLAAGVLSLGPSTYIAPCSYFSSLLVTKNAASSASLELLLRISAS